MGLLLSICYEPRQHEYEETHIVYAPYCNGCNRRIEQQFTLKDGKYLSFFCSEACKLRYITRGKTTQYTDRGEDQVFRLSSPFATPGR